MMVNVIEGVEAGGWWKLVEAGLDGLELRD